MTKRVWIFPLACIKRIVETKVPGPTRKGKTIVENRCDKSAFSGNLTAADGPKITPLSETIKTIMPPATFKDVKETSKTLSKIKFPPTAKIETRQIEVNVAK